MKNFITYLWVLTMLTNNACNEPMKKPAENKKTAAAASGTFGYDLEFLSKYDQVVVLKSDDSNAQIIISPKYQGKVFTSTAENLGGTSFGWVNYKAFGAPVSAHMNAYGGENRFWLGPEGGRFSLFFKPAAKMDLENWKTPPSIDTESWTLLNKNDHSAMLQKDIRLVNYQGTELSLTVDRTIRLLTRSQIAEKIGVASESSVKTVGYETNNVITNKSSQEWTEKTGMPCIWLLDMFRPSPQTTIVVPFNNPQKDSFSLVATTNYFGKIADDRLKHADAVLFFRADGKSRGKLGVHPSKVKPVAGSYDAAGKILTIILFDTDPQARYLNQEWNTTKPAFSGDAMNAYNDGPLGDGTQMGPFYEIESVSPAAFLKPGQSLGHHHSVFHFTGDGKGLDRIAQKMLGVSLENISQPFRNSKSQ